MGATLSQPYIPLLPRSIKSKSKKRPRYLFRFRIRCKKKKTLPEIHAPFANPSHDHREESRDSKLYNGSSAEGEESSPSHQSLPISFANDKPLPKLPLVIAPAAQFSGQQAQLNSSSDRPATEAIQPIINAPSENTNQEDDNEDVSDSEHSDFLPETERPHTPPPWDTSLSGYGSVLEVSRPFRARRVFEHPLVEGHFLGSYQGDSFLSNGGVGGGPMAAEERRRVWRVWESTIKKEKETWKGEEKETEKEKEKEKGEYKNGGVVDDDDDEWKKKKKKKKMVGGLKSARQQKAIERENERKRERGHKKEKNKDKSKMPPIKTQTNTKTKTRRRMSEWRKWKPLPRYPACTAVAQRATSSMWADTGDSAWREVFVEKAEDRENHGGDEKEGEADQDEHGNNEDEDLEEAIKRFLEIQIPVDLSSLRRLRTSFAGDREHAMAVDDGTGETAKKVSEKEVLEKVMEGEQSQLSPVESLMFTDTDIEGFEFLENVKPYKMDGLIGGFAGGDASRAEGSEEDAGHNLTVRTAFNVTQRLSRWKERE
ncbi:hypothetical protein B0T13DRAFT_519680 [Neurospora crassa]|nr:hypothetical protein B0T13DRAFT_519680 [Neurospora crassa]